MNLRTACLVLALGPLVGAQAGFRDVTDVAGLGGPYMPNQIFDFDPWMISGGVAVFDYDNDGWDDIFWPGGDLQLTKLYHNDGDGTFTNVAGAAGVEIQAPVNSPSFADYDNDGDLDMFLTMYMDYSLNGAPVAYRNILYRNNGDGTFTDVTPGSGLEVSGRFGATWGDLDNDGWLDLVTVTWSLDDSTYFFRNLGDGTFVEKTPPAIKADPIFGFSPVIIDYDADGDQDVLTAGDWQTSRVWRNDGRWQFSIVNGTIVDGMDLDDDNGMGQTVGDFNSDGILDWVVTSTYAEDIPMGWTPKSGNRLYLGKGDGTFTDGTTDSNIRDGGWGWGAQICDIHNDGQPDFVNVNGMYLPAFPEMFFLEESTPRVYVNNGDGTCTDQAVVMDVDDVGQGRGLVLFDYNRDGKQDILTSNNDIGLVLYKNREQVGNWIDVQVRARYGSPYGPGTKVSVWHPTLGTQTKWINHGCNFLSQSPPRTWFGVANTSKVYVSVVFPSGMQMQRTVSTNKRITFTEPEFGTGTPDVGFVK